MAPFNSFINVVINSSSTISMDGTFVLMGEDGVRVTVTGTLSIWTSRGIVATHLGGATTIFANDFAKVSINGTCTDSKSTVLTTQEDVQVATNGTIAVTTIASTISLANGSIELSSGSLVATTKEGMFAIGLEEAK